MQRAIKDDKPTEDDEQILTMLDQGALEDTIRADLDRLANGGKADPPLQKVIVDLTTQLQKVVDQAETAKAATRFAKLKAKIHRAVQR